MGAYDVHFYSKQFYDHKARWIHYFNQIRAVADEIRLSGGDMKNFSVLEVGPTHGLVTWYLRKFGVEIKTLDYKEEYKPDFVGDVVVMPIPDNSFDMIVVCEVLEHLPFADLPKALKELRRVAKKTVFMSVPDARRTVFSARIKLPFLKEISIWIRIPTFTKQIITTLRGHNWEIGKLGYPVSRVLDEIQKAGFVVEKNWVSHDTPRNHYFLLRK